MIGNGDPLALFQGTVGLGEWLIVGCVMSWTVYTFIGWQASGRFRRWPPRWLCQPDRAILLGWRRWSRATSTRRCLVVARLPAEMASLAIFGTAIAYTWFADDAVSIGAGHASIFINLVPVRRAAGRRAARRAPGLAVLGRRALVIAGVWLTKIKRKNNMILTQEQEMIRDSMRAFAQERLAPCRRMGPGAHLPGRGPEGTGRTGAMGMVVPEEWGGAGMDYMSLVLTLEEIAAGDGATSTIVSVQNSLACGIPQKYGTDAQKEEWLKPLARGEKLGCFCLTEPHTGSDASAITTRADRDGDHFVLNGVKQFITTGSHCRRCRHRLSRSPTRQPARRASPLLVPTATPGFMVARIERKMGQHASDTAQIVFEDCRIPASALLGKEGEGYKIALSNLEAGRIGIAAQSVGMARAAFEAAVACARTRHLRRADHRTPGRQFPPGRHGLPGSTPPA